MTVTGYWVALLIVVTGCASGTGPLSADAPAKKEQSPEPPMSEREKDLIRGQIEGNWVVDAGMAGLEDMIVVIVVEMNPDGSVQSAQIDRSTARDDPNWQVFAESCRRAIFRSSSLRMPADKPYQAWKTMKLTFSGRELSKE